MAAKGQESDDLRSENDALRAENTRLTDLTRMLLSSSAFSSFLNDLSANSIPTLPPAVPNQIAPNTQQPQQQLRKDVNPHQQQMQAQHDENAQVGMVLMPETNMDFSSMEPINSWGIGMDFGYNAQVFSVTDIPEGPAADLLSGKSQDPVTRILAEAKDDMPSIEPMPAVAKTEQTSERTTEACATICDDADFDESDPAFALFADNNATVEAPITPESQYQIFGSIGLEKAVARLDLIIDDDSNSEEDKAVHPAVMNKFLIMCSGLDMVSSRLSHITSHL